MDEPLSALDRQLRESMQIEIKQLQREFRFTAVYVTHDQQEALAMSDRIAVMNHGRVEQIDTPTRLYKEPATEFVAGFVGECNRLANFTLIDEKVGLAEGPGGTRLYGYCKEIMRKGDMVVLMVRPEDMLIEPGESTSDTVLNGHITDLVFAGDLLRVHVMTDFNQGIWLKSYGNRDTPSLAVGRPVHFSIDPARCLIFKDRRG